jgi:hypothetical protein
MVSICGVMFKKRFGQKESSSSLIVQYLKIAHCDKFNPCTVALKEEP